MPNLCIDVTACGPEVGNTGRVLIEFSMSGSDGNFTTGSVALDFLASSVQMNIAVIDAAKAAYRTAFGVTFAPTDKIALFGGVV